MIFKGIEYSLYQPSRTDIAWAKPVEGGFALYLYLNGGWKPQMLMNDMGTDTPEDDEPITPGGVTPAVYGTDTFDGGSKAADTFTQGTAPTLATGTAVTAQGTFSAGSAATLATSAAVTAQGTFSAGSPATVATGKAITAVGTGTAAAQVFSGTQATITVE